jgi:hypothetical protein
MAIKRLICPERVRKVPAQFSWVDHRLVRERHIERCDVHAAALYLFLVTVADAQGLSYYSDVSVARRLSMDPSRLIRARTDLIRLGLLAYERPLYQVLALDAPAPEDVRTRLDQLREILGKHHDRL